PDPPKEVPDVVRLADALLARFPEKGKEWAHITLEIALSPATSSEALAIGQWYAKEGDWRWAYTVGVKVLSLLPCPRAYRLAYPKAWEESVLHWAREYQVDPFLIWAVMREESGFFPTAVSSSGARGLMQLLPSTARWITEEKLHIPYREELLFDPDYNIRLGTWYLRYLLDQFQGNTAWAVAAYNAGPGNIRRWTEKEVSSLPDLPGALWSIETREYLVKVLNSWLVYRELYGSLR
ncbi:lytic transglycosylase domain-containing protein, partial [Candidatus Bipolaricaulota bacterium]|nr:lytic transglycosylase domain-containing protein [Candidatus Bipolaricaulota bacterium]